MRLDPPDTGATPWRPGAVANRPPLARWQAALAAATDTDPIDVVLVTDSLFETATGGPSAAQMLHRALNAAAGVVGADPLTGAGIPVPVHAQGSTSTTGTGSTVATGGQGSTLAGGGILTHQATATGFALVYRTEPGFGSLTIRDGAGGTILDTISCTGPDRSGNLWLSPTLTAGTHTLHLTSTGTTRPELVMPLQGTRVRVWPCGLAGSTSAQFQTYPERSLDFIATIGPALVIVATGTNDDGAPEAAAELVATVKAATTAEVVQWVPYPSTGFPQSELDAFLPYVRSGPADLIIDTTTVLDQAVTIDGTHPAGQTRAIMAAHIAAVLGGDPIGAALRLAGALTASRGTTSTALTDSGMIAAGDTGVLRTAAATISVGSPLSLLLGSPDGQVRAQRLGLTPLGAVPAGPNAVGDIAMVSGTVRVCTTAGTPGTWTVIGTQT